jgi:hypothetical protein
MLQFTEPIPESALLPSIELTKDMRRFGVEEDKIVALLQGQQDNA